MPSVSDTSPLISGGNSMPVKGGLSAAQTVIAVCGLTSVTVLAALGDISSEAYMGIAGTVIGGALGYVNGKKAAS